GQRRAGGAVGAGHGRCRTLRGLPLTLESGAHRVAARWMLMLAKDGYTVVEQLLEEKSPVDVAEQVAHVADHVIRKPLACATAATITEMTIPADEMVLIASDGGHDQIDAGVLEGRLVREHHGVPQALADALVAAAGGRTPLRW
ncbi:hypothetical protein AB0D04_33115, partial [Streptomyces sp. NPDC048483]